MKVLEHWALGNIRFLSKLILKSPRTYSTPCSTATLPTREEEAPSHGRNEETIMPALI